MAVKRVNFTPGWLDKLERRLRLKDDEFINKQSRFYDERQESAHLRIRVMPTCKAYYYIQYRPPVSERDRELISAGELKRPGPTTFKIGGFTKVSFADAVTMARDAWAKLADGVNPKTSRDIDKQLEGPTIREAINKKIDELGRKRENGSGLSDSYISTLRRQIRTLEKHAMADRKMREITPEEVKKLLVDIPARIQAEGAKRGTGEETAKKIVNLINSTYNFAMSYYWTDENPSRAIVTYNPCDPLRVVKKIRQRGSTKRTRRKAIKQEEFRKVWHAFLELEKYVPNRHNTEVINNVVASHYFRFQLLTGLRGGTISQLTFDQYDWRRRTFYFFEDDAYKTKNNNEKFFMPLSDEAAEIVDRMYKRHGKVSDYVFTNATYKKGIDVGCKEQIKIVRRNTSMNFKSHDLRGTFLTIAESLEMNWNIITQLADHTSKTSNVTAGYLDSEVEKLRRSTQQIADVILQSAGVKEKVKEPEVIQMESNPFNIKDGLHYQLQKLAEKKKITLKQAYERCLKIGVMAYRKPDDTAAEIIEDVEML